MRDLEEVIILATQLHGNQTDKSGRPYISHPQRVAEMVRRSGGNWVQEQAAWLHDSVEDTDATVERLLGAGVAGVVVTLVEALTHYKQLTNQEYWSRLKDTDGAALVKLCDIYDNLDPSRLCYLNEGTQARLRLKYSRALAALA